MCKLAQADCSDLIGQEPPLITHTLRDLLAGAPGVRHLEAWVGTNRRQKDCFQLVRRVRAGEYTANNRQRNDSGQNNKTTSNPQNNQQSENLNSQSARQNPPVTSS